MMKKSGFGALEGLTDVQIKQMINWQDPSGMTPLHIAIKNLNLVHVQKLVKLQADCSLPDSDGNTALHYAAECGDLEILNVVADASDDLDLQNNEGETPVFLAAHAGYIGAVVSLTSMEKHVVPADTSILDMRGRTLLMHACISGDLDLVRLILLNKEGNSQRSSISKIYINATDNDGVSALMYAAMDGHWHLLPLLVSNRANIASKDKRGFTALHWAATFGNPATVAALIDLGAVVNERDSKDWTPLMHAVEENNLEVVQLLLECGGNPDRTLALAKTDAMHFSICDALRDKLVGNRKIKPIQLNGRLIVSILWGKDFYIDPSSVLDGTGQIYAYAIVQFKTSGDPDESEMVAISQAVPISPLIEWNEPLTFFIREKSVTTDCVLSIEIFATKDPEPITALYNTEHASGEDEGTDAIDLDEQERIRHEKMDLMYREIQKYERSHNDNRDAIRAKLEEYNFSDHKKRWNQLLEIRKRLMRYKNRYLPLPPVPPGHFPCGSITLSFSRLREVFRGNLVQFTRFPRCIDRGQLRFDIDYVATMVNSAEFRRKFEIPKTPKSSEIHIDVPEGLLEFEPSDSHTFATRAVKLAAESRRHYQRWWSRISKSRVVAEEETHKGTLAEGKQKKRNEKSEDLLLKIVQIIAKQLVPEYG
jgi:ankyrin repeat protein